MTLLSKLTDTNRTFSIIELGCGIPVAHSFMLQSGASKVLTMASCPYNREYQYKLTGINSPTTRSVSIEMVQELLVHLKNESIGENFHIAYSIQAGSTAKICHGFVGITFGNQGFIYHVTLGQGITKGIAGLCMSSIVEDIIEVHILGGKMSTISKDGQTSFIDGAWSNYDVMNISGKSSYLFDPSKLPINFGTFCFAAGEWHRPAEIFRQLTGDLCIIKGSFNPIHDGHKQLVGNASDFTNIPLMCMTSMSIDGKQASATEMVDRALAMPGAVCVIDSHNVYMRELIEDLSQWDPTKKIRLFMGIDVFAKFDVTDVTEDVAIHVFYRECSVKNITFKGSMYPTLSSTSIRNSNEASKPVV